ncbi:MAG: type II toxin-antitoxin system RelE/ParE family toxin [Cruoricaptor ignavus]|nr:type II toxin-antitoxin system RelE/ParE family toxin [Cruoricaptor ignavus]
MKYFETKFLEEARDFIKSLDSKIVRKIFYNIDLAEQTNDPKLFKKLNENIWEFRTRYAGIQIRLLAFWDKTEKGNTLVFATHGFKKKVSKVPLKEIDKAEKIMENYFKNK